MADKLLRTMYKTLKELNTKNFIFKFTYLASNDG